MEDTNSSNFGKMPISSLSPEQLDVDLLHDWLIDASEVFVSLGLGYRGMHLDLPTVTQQSAILNTDQDRTT